MQIATNPAIQYIQAAGVSGFINGVRNGCYVMPEAAPQAFKALGEVIDTYKEAVPEDLSLDKMREIIKALSPHGRIPPDIQRSMLSILFDRENSVESAIRIALMRGNDHSVNGGQFEFKQEAPLDLGSEWKWIPEGLAVIGAEEKDVNAAYYEKPLRLIFTGGFYMLDHPVTNAEFRRWLQRKGLEDWRNLPDDFNADDHPAVAVNYRQAVEYSDWLGFMLSDVAGHDLFGKLPSESEWEKAARGPSGTEYSKASWLDLNWENRKTFRNSTLSVNREEAIHNGYGLKDMMWNVLEWTSSPFDRFSPEKYQNPYDIRDSEVSLRGGSWKIPNLRAFLRIPYGVRHHDLFVGFRPIIVPDLIKTGKN